MIDNFISQLFYRCVYILQVIGDVTGMGYILSNIVIFIIIQPALILFFFFMWMIERNRR